MIRFKQWYDVKAMTREEKRLFNVWKSMRFRCNNPNNPAYADYGGRGIKVCERWENSFKDYFNDVGIPPDPSYELDRIDNNKGYEPGNVRYVTHQKNMLNVRNNRYIPIERTINGVKTIVTKTMSEWADENGLDRPTLHSRLKMGWTGERLISPPNKGMIVDINGVLDTSANWAKKVPMSQTGFEARYNRGVRGLDLLKPSAKVKNNPFLKISLATPAACVNQEAHANPA